MPENSGFNQPRHRGKKSADTEGLTAGIHAVEALLTNAPMQANHLMILQDSRSPKLHELQKLAKAAGVRTHQVPRSRLDRLYPGPHQGIVAFRNATALWEWNKLRDKLLCDNPEKKPIRIIVAAAMEDPRNFGACLRSCAAFGFDAMLQEEKGCCGLTPTAAKAAAGAAEIVPVSRVRNMPGELGDLKNAGFKILGLDAGGKEALHEVSIPENFVLIIGGEYRGIPPHLKRLCDDLVHIPINPQMPSLNASAALTVCLYEINRRQFVPQS